MQLLGAVLIQTHWRKCHWLESPFTCHCEPKAKQSHRSSRPGEQNGWIATLPLVARNDRAITRDPLAIAASKLGQYRQMELASQSAPKGEARQAGRGATEALPAGHEPESPASTNRLMEEVCERDNLKAALQGVKANKGSAGVDGMTVGELTGYLKQHWPAIRDQLLNGTYAPQPVKRVDIPKPAGGVRKLGIPTVLDRFLQQAVLQVLQRHWDRTFSEHSYGFPAGTLGASRGGPGTAVHRRRLPVGG